MTAPADSGTLVVAGLRKRYGSTIALDGLDIEIRPGEVLGIAGPNGAGKSTLVRMLAGEERPDSGTMTLAAEAWEPHLPGARVAVVHQEPQLFPNLTVAQNMVAGREGTRVTRPRLTDSDRTLMAAVGIGGFADRFLEDVTLATQQRTEIARALARNARLFLFDEPNSALTDDESNELFSQMHEIAAGGRLVVLITHRLGDLAAHAKRVAVIRDGQVRAMLEGEALTEEGIAQQLVLGGERGDAPAARAQATSREDAYFAASRWTHRKGTFADVDLRVGRGEVVALMGVEGSGARELLRSFAGLERASGGLEVAGVRDGAYRLTAYVPATRQLSLYSNFTVGENLLVRLGRPEIAGPILNLRRRNMRELAAAAVQRFLVKTRTLTQMIRSLSGGNQQKVAIAQALAADPRMILLEEPTRGVDIQSKREIYRLLREYAAAGNAVLIFCTEVLEVFEAADRVIVVSDGRLSPSLAIGDHTHVEVLATAISRLERHSRQVPAAA